MKAVGVGDVEMLERLQVTRLQRGMRRDGIVDAVEIHAKCAQLASKLLQRGAGLVALRDKGPLVRREGFRIRAAQQQVFPFLDLLLELDLRDARRIGGVTELLKRLRRLDLQRVGMRERVPSFESHDHG